MKYLKTLNVWDHSIQQAIKSGQIKLQVGQWLSCGNGRKSRYVSHTKHTMNVVHWQGSAKETNELFRDRINAPKNLKELMKKKGLIQA